MEQLNGEDHGKTYPVFVIREWQTEKDIERIIMLAIEEELLDSAEFSDEAGRRDALH